MSVFTLKLIAVFCMICDHIRYIDYESAFFNNTCTKILGRIAFPIFAFMIAEGYSHTKNVKKYIQRLGIFAIISQIPFLMFIWGCGITEKFELNVIFTMFIGVCSLLIYDKVGNKFLKVVGMVALCVLAQLLKTDYGALGVLAIIIFYVLKNTKFIKYLVFLAFFVFKYKISLIALPYIIGYVFSIIPLLFYNEKIGKYKLKYFFYIFYPAHMVVIYLIYNFIN